MSHVGRDVALVLTERLELRSPVEGDRDRLVELFCDDDFMVFSGVLDHEQANARFDLMLANASELPFAKQPIIEQATNQIVGYTGVDWFDFEGERRPEFGYRLNASTRGKGYATEAGLALLDFARSCFQGTIYAIIDPTNNPSMRVAKKLGFEYSQQAIVDGDLRNLYRIEMP